MAIHNVKKFGLLYMAVYCKQHCMAVYCKQHCVAVVVHTDRGCTACWCTLALALLVSAVQGVLVVYIPWVFYPF